ncbi:hypothetical protein BKA80DRAFT_277400 [Phyllosticta citrichinensis]
MANPQYSAPSLTASSSALCRLDACSVAPNHSACVTPTPVIGRGLREQVHLGSQASAEAIDKAEDPLHSLASPVFGSPGSLFVHLLSSPMPDRRCPLALTTREPLSMYARRFVRALYGTKTTISCDGRERPDASSGLRRSCCSGTSTRPLLAPGTHPRPKHA